MRALRWLFLVPVAAVLMLAAVVIAGADTPGTYSFTGRPSAPLAVTQLGQYELDIQAHTRQPAYWYTPEAVNAQHGADCAGPPATHAATTWDAMVFQCNDHLMTSLNASDYGVIYLTPNALADWSGGSAIVQWEMSTARQSVRDWPDLWITSYGTNLTLPLDKSLPDLQGPPRNAYHVSFNTTEFAPILTVVRNGNETDYNAGWNTDSARGDIAAGTNQAATRQTFRLTITPTKLTFERLASATGQYIQFWSYSVPDLGFRQGVVQLGHHSYTPTKDNSGTPGTWHWDELQIAPSVPFTMVKADRRYVDGSGGVVRFDAPAPANAYLRFSAIGAVTVDGANAGRQASGADDFFPEHFSSYFVPIAEGATEVTIGLTAQAYPGFARDFAIWALGSSSPTGTPVPPTPTVDGSPVPTNTATNTPTAIVPATARRTPTRFPTPTAQAIAFAIAIRPPRSSPTPTQW